MMICCECSLGGLANGQAEQLSDPKLAEMLRNEAAKLHAKCEGRCDCQHRIGSGWINPQMMRETDGHS